MVPPAPRVAAVVVNYNGFDVTRDAVESLRLLDYPSFDLAVVDNGSTDGSADRIEAAFPGLHQERVAINQGSSAGYEHALRWGYERGYDYVLLLNNDIEVEPDLLTRMVEMAEADPRIGCVGPKCYFHGERRRLWSAGGGTIRYRNSVTHERGYGEIDRGQYDGAGDLDYVTGCAMLVKRAAAEAAGGWDPVYFLFVDDADFCTRVRAAGFRCVPAPRAVLYHRVAYSTGGYTAGRNVRLGRSSALYVRRYANRWQTLSFLAFSLLAAGAAFLRELPKGNSGAALAKLRGIREAFRMQLPDPPRLRKT